jgi:6-phospho-beta-glucosidase
MKITVIGGGSSYTPELFSGLIDRASSLDLAEVHLHDIDKERLDVVAGFCSRMAAAAKADFTLKATGDLAEAVSGASFVVTQIRVGGNAARKQDELLGMRHGLIGQETTGVGGFAKAMRTIPAMLEICGAIEKESPGAWLINFTNPSGIITEAVLKHSGVKAIGLCNIPVTFHIEMAKALSAKREEVEIESVGLNHLSWVRGIKVGGDDVFDKVLEWAGSAGRPANIEELDYPPEFLKALRMIPMHYLHYFYQTRKMLEAQKTRDKTRAMEVMEIESELMDIYCDESADEKPEMLSRRGGAHYSLAALELIEGIHFDKGDVQVVDVMNNATIPGLPDDAVIETSCRIGREGGRPLPVREPEPVIMGLIRSVKAYEELTVQAAVEKSYEKALLALAVHPLGPDADHAKEVLEDIIATHGNFFETGNEEIKSSQ